MDVNASELAYRELYNIVLSSVGPRPIAWVSTLSSSGQPNLAPFSFFNCVCMDPPLLAFAPGLRPSKSAAGEESPGEPKDTLRNVRETKEFVVNVVTYDLLQQMNITSGLIQVLVGFHAASPMAAPLKPNSARNALCRVPPYG